MKTGLWVIGALCALLLLGTLFARQISNGIAGHALSKIGAMIDPTTQDILVQQRQIAANLAQAETRSTDRAKAMDEEIRLLRGQNQALATELKRIGGTVTAISRSVAAIDIGGADTVQVGEGDFTHEYTDPWVKATVARQAGQLRFRYDITFKLEEFDVEVTLPGGTKTHLFNTALVSTTTGDTLNVPTERHVIERLPGGSRFYWNPTAHMTGSAGLGSAWLGGIASLFSFGSGRYIDGSYVYLLGAGVVHDGDHWGVLALPFSWNAGGVLPLVRNLNVGPVWMWGDRQSGFGIMLGAAL